MKRRYEQTVNGGWVEVLIPETPEEDAEIERRVRAGEVDADASFGDKRPVVDTEETTPEP